MDLRWHINTALAQIAIKFLKWSKWYDGYWNHWRGDIFNYAQKQGLHILPVHYYSPIPNTAELPTSVWNNQSELKGINLNIESGLELLTKLSTCYQQEYLKFPSEPINSDREYYLNNSAYGRGDAEILYSMIRHIKPKRIIEIGSGRTTLLISQAINQNKLENTSYSCDFLAIEPYPPEYLVPPPAEVTKMLPVQLQLVPIDQFTCLEENDILFIDSTHVASIGSDVVYEYLEILPRLASGVMVHIDDIFLPMNYPKKWIDEARFFWNEQYLLQAFLSFNQAFQVIMPTYALSKQYTEVFEACIPSCKEQKSSPSSFWIKKT
ncbi:hypothetical protein NIES4102_01200 [Chondrocystis sp. NIES-4102]|nr:hypothetical protein NIES4102_01200 [Chondrocystis sp. NIES-4102]